MPCVCRGKSRQGNAAMLAEKGEETLPSPCQADLRCLHARDLKVWFFCEDGGLLLSKLALSPGDDGISFGDRGLEVSAWMVVRVQSEEQGCWASLRPHFRGPQEVQCEVILFFLIVRSVRTCFCFKETQPNSALCPWQISRTRRTLLCIVPSPSVRPSRQLQP